MNTIITPYRLYKDIDLNFLAHPNTHDVTKKLDVNSVKQSIMLLINTQFGERLFHPEDGSPLYGLLFEPIDPITTEVLKRSIEQVLQNHEPRIALNLLIVTPKYEDNEYYIYLQVTVVGILIPITFSFTLQRLR